LVEIETDWVPSENDREASKDEDKRMGNVDPSAKSLNRIN